MIVNEKGKKKGENPREKKWEGGRSKWKMEEEEVVGKRRDKKKKAQ